MNGRIFLRGPKGELHPLDEAPYESEHLLQAYIAEHPDLLAGYQMNEADPRRFLLVRREHGVADSNSVRWAIDHVFVDQEAVPTLVEVKRSTDTRVRREVVGQIVEYAANGAVYWPAGTLRSSFESRCAREGLDPMEELSSRLGAEAEYDAFWEQADANLRDGTLRLIIASDRVSPELQRIVEFLNEQLEPTEILALEVRQFVGEGVQTLVPRIVGSTMVARDRKTSPATRTAAWSAEEYLERIEGAGRHKEAEASRSIFDWARQNDLGVEGGRGGKSASIYFVDATDPLHLRPLSLYEGYGKGGLLQVLLDQMGVRFEGGAQLRAELCAELQRVTGKGLSPDAHYPGIPMSVMTDGGVRAAVLEILARAIRAARASGEEQVESSTGD